MINPYSFQISQISNYNQARRWINAGPDYFFLVDLEIDIHALFAIRSSRNPLRHLLNQSDCLRLEVGINHALDFDIADSAISLYHKQHPYHSLYSIGLSLGRILEMGCDILLQSLFSSRKTCLRILSMHPDIYATHKYH